MYLTVLIDASWTSPSMQPPWQSWKEAQKRMLLSTSARSSTGRQTTEWSGRRSAAAHPRRQNTTLILSGAEAVAVGTLRPLALNPSDFFEVICPRNHWKARRKRDRDQTRGSVANIRHAQ